ncbi:hypothetical protein AB1K56_11290 [Microbacterium sp. BWR-S6Y]|uniref:hypothetical protein n=1 Tax=Microbacterium sp. BWR-S6Y TaxID=3232073 RepID=UPI003528BC5B
MDAELLSRPHRFLVGGVAGRDGFAHRARVVPGTGEVAQDLSYPRHRRRGILREQLNQRDLRVGVRHHHAVAVTRRRQRHEPRDRGLIVRSLAESDCVVARGTTDAFAVVAMCAALGVNRVIVLGSVPTDDERLAGQPTGTNCSASESSPRPRWR